MKNLFNGRLFTITNNNHVMKEVNNFQGNVKLFFIVAFSKYFWPSYKKIDHTDSAAGLFLGSQTTLP